MRYCESIPEEHELRVQALATDIFPEWARAGASNETAFSQFLANCLSLSGLPKSEKYAQCLDMHLMSLEQEMTVDTEQKLRQLATNLHLHDWRRRPQPGVAAAYFGALEAEVEREFSNLPMTPRRIICYANYLSDYYLSGRTR